MIPIYFKLELIVFCLFEFFSISLGQVDDKANSVCFLQSSLFEHVYSDSIQNIHTVHSCCSNSSNFSVVYLLSCRKWKIRWSLHLKMAGEQPTETFKNKYTVRVKSNSGIKPCGD